MIARLKASMTPMFSPVFTRRDSMLIEDVLGIAALFALLFFALAVPVSV